MGHTDNQEVGLEAAILKRKRNSSLVKWPCAENSTGLKHVAEAVDFYGSGRGAFQRRRRCSGRNAGGSGSENADMSNDKPGEKPGRRKPKVSCARVIRAGLAGPKPRPKGVGDGKRVNIPVPPLGAERGRRRIGQPAIGSAGVSQ